MDHVRHRTPTTGAIIAGRYRVLRELGRGGMSVVFECEQIDLERRVAVKLLRAELADLDEARRRTCEEAKAAAQLTGKHIAQVYDTGETAGGLPYIVTELLRGMDLRDVLQQRGPLPVREAAAILNDVCAAVAEAHDAGIVHRDLKPENVFLARERGRDGVTVKVLDFGISKRVTRGGRSLTQPGSLVGSPEYMSPEQMRRPDTVDGRSDIWSLGVLAYELVIGETPFVADEVPEVYARVLRERPPRMPADDPERSLYGGIVAKCLQRDPNHRFQTLGELSRALAPLRDGGALPLVADAQRYDMDEEPEPVELPMRRSGPWARVAAVVVLSAAAAAGVALYQRDTGTDVAAAATSWVKGAFAPDVERAAQDTADDEVAPVPVATAVNIDSDAVSESDAAAPMPPTEEQPSGTRTKVRASTNGRARVAAPESGRSSVDVAAVARSSADRAEDEAFEDEDLDEALDEALDFDVATETDGAKSSESEDDDAAAVEGDEPSSTERETDVDNPYAIPDTL